MKEKRLTWLDISKGIAILMVLLGHGIRDSMRLESGAMDYVYRICYVFHMLFFFFLSGYTLNKSISKYKHVSTVLIKKVKTLFIPWIGYTILICCVFQVAFLISPIRKILEGAGYSSISVFYYLGKVVQINNDWAYHLWFLFVLFIISCLFIVFDIPRTRHVLIYAIVALSLFTVGYDYYSFLGDWNDLFFHLAIYIPYFFLGYIVDVQKMVEARKSNLLLVVLEVMGVCYIFIRAKWFSDFYGNNIAGETKLIRVSIAYMGYILMPFAMIALCKVSDRIDKFSLPGTEQLSWLGKNSFNIYLWHQPFCCAFLGIVLYEKLHIGSIFTVIACVIASVLVGILVTNVKSIIKQQVKLETRRNTNK